MGLVSTDPLDQRNQDAGARLHWVVADEATQGYYLTGGRVTKQSSDRGYHYTLIRECIQCK